MGKDRYYYGEGYNQKRGNVSWLWVAVRILFFVISLIAAFALALTLLAPFIPPYSWWVFPILGLIAPAVYVANFVIAMVLIIRWKWWFALPIIILLILGVGRISRFVKLDINKEYSSQIPRRSIKIMSCNLRGHIRDDKQWASKEVAHLLDSISPDILCAQEFRKDNFEANLPQKFKNYNCATAYDLAIYTRFAIISQSQKNNVRGAKGEVSYSMWADVKIGSDTVRIFNNHLASTTINNTDDRYLTSREFVADSLREDKLIDMLRRFKNSSNFRAQHADSLKQIIDSSPHRVIVCGDFNDTPMSYTYNKMSRELHDSFDMYRGKGYPYTYRGFMNTLRIDYILGSEGVAFHSYTIYKDITISDHLPITAQFTLN